MYATEFGMCFLEAGFYNSNPYPVQYVDAESDFGITVYGLELCKQT